MPTRKVTCARSATPAPIQFIHKKDKSLSLCMDYRSLNRLTIPNKYPLWLISELFDTTIGEKWFIRLDLKNMYNLIRIAAGDKWKTAFHTKQGLFGSTVMPFGLINTCASFQEMLDAIFKVMQGCIWCLDNILICSNNPKLSTKPYWRRYYTNLLNMDSHSTCLKASSISKRPYSLVMSSMVKKSRWISLNSIPWPSSPSLQRRRKFWRS